MRIYKATCNQIHIDISTCMIEIPTIMHMITTKTRVHTHFTQNDWNHGQNISNKDFTTRIANLTLSMNQVYANEFKIRWILPDRYVHLPIIPQTKNNWLLGILRNIFNHLNSTLDNEVE